MSIDPLDHQPLWHLSLARSIDRITIAKYEISEKTLMESAAARTVASIPDSRLQNAAAIILAGPGNNGGDALLIGRLIEKRVAKVHLFLHSKESPLDEDAVIQLLQSDAKKILIDGIFGLGYRKTKQKSKLYAAASKCKNLFTVAIDLPSGMEADRFDKVSPLLPIDLTVTFGAKKICTTLAPARDFCGEVILADPGFHPQAIAEAISKDLVQIRELNAAKLLRQNPFDRLAKSAHKYDRGHVLVIGGSAGKFGAPILTAMAAYRTGAGWVSVALPEKPTLGKIPFECTFEDFFLQGKINCTALSKFLKTRKVACIVIGPGTMKSPIDKKVLKVLQSFANSGGKIVIDAGATAGWLDHKTKFPEGSLVLTPHPGEWKKLRRKGFSVPENLEDLNICKQKLSSGTWIFKGATPILLQPSKLEKYISTTGTNALSKAGSGDVLAGIIAAHLAVGCEGIFAAARSLAVLAKAGELASLKRGTHGIIAGDLTEALAQI